MTTKKIFTLVFIKNDNDLLMGLKTRGLGVGFWNGFGGKVEKLESIVDAAKRELKEECNLTAKELKQIGVLACEEDDRHLSIVHIFTVDRCKCNGSPQPSEEMNPLKWFNFENIPYKNMWPSASFWYPLMLQEKYFSAIIAYDVCQRIKKKDIRECTSLEEVFKNIDVLTKGHG